MRRVLLGSALVLFSACPIGDSGDVGCVPKPGLAFPTTVGPGATTETLVTTQGMLSIEGPSVTCIPSDPSIITVTATLSGGSQPARIVPSTIALSTGTDSLIKVDVSGAQPGEYSLQIFVEPTIAAINKEVIVAVDRSKPPTPRLEPACSGKHGRTALGTSICSDGSPEFLARLPDGGSVVFNGTDVSLAGDVLWLERTTDAGTIVERHVEHSSGQFERTHVIRVDDTVDAVDEHHVWAGTTFATTWEDGGSSTLRTRNGDQARLRIIEEGRGLEFPQTDEICEMDGGCWSIEAFKGREIANVGSKNVWFEQENGGLIRGLPRPLSAGRVSAVISHTLPDLQLHLYYNRAFRLRSPAALVLTPPSVVTLLIERRDGLFELWQPQRGWALRDATDSLVEFDVAPGQTAVFLR